MKQCYTSQKSANRGPHKVNSRSYVGRYVPPVVGSSLSSSAQSVSVEPCRIPWYVRLWRMILKIFKK